MVKVTFSLDEATVVCVDRTELAWAAGFFDATDNGTSRVDVGGVAGSVREAEFAAVLLVVVSVSEMFLVSVEWSL